MRPVLSPAATALSFTSNAIVVIGLVWCSRNVFVASDTPVSRRVNGHTITVCLSQVPRNVPFGEQVSRGGDCVFSNLSTDFPLPKENAWTRPPAPAAVSFEGASAEFAAFALVFEAFTRCQHERKITSRPCALRPPGITMLSTGPGAVSTAPGEPSCAFHRRTVPSKDAVNTTCPPGCPGWNPTAVTSAACPDNGDPTGKPVAVLKQRTASPEHTYRRPPSGDTALGRSVNDPPATCVCVTSTPPLPAGRCFAIATMITPGRNPTHRRRVPH
mmetsp:Transcript_269/g.1023  ORF Transcript_269/g.1023 Transcript_269/m.1023 type:complete len:272 (-) Transcript_269:103-918(-)